MSMSDFPEEYTDGYVLFCWHRCLVDTRALIPRIETEELIKYALHILETNPQIQTIADIGTGSGVIPLSLARKSKQALNVIATDISQEALNLAQENFARLETGIVRESLFLQWDLLTPLIRHFGSNTPHEIVITANLPYVLTREVVWDLIYEPKIAFIGGEKTGFELYERFFQQLHNWKNRPKICHIVIEFWLWQRDVAETILLGYPWKYTFFSDLRDIERFCYIVIT